MHYNLAITETGRISLKDIPRTFNTIIETHKTIKEVKNSLIERYGKLPNKRNKIYIANRVIGFTYSFWNQDISHNSKKWFQTDWIEIRKVYKKTILI